MKLINETLLVRVFDKIKYQMNSLHLECNDSENSIDELIKNNEKENKKLMNSCEKIIEEYISPKHKKESRLIPADQEPEQYDHGMFVINEIQSGSDYLSDN